MAVDQLDAVFGALADSTRRAILERLTEGDASVAEIAAPFTVSQPAISRHLKVLEDAGWISRSWKATVRLSHLEAEPLREATEWLAGYREIWEESYERLDALLAALQRSGTVAPAGATRQEGVRHDQDEDHRRNRGSTQIIAPGGRRAPELVYRAYTEPDLLLQWLGPRRLTMKIDRYEARDGSSWRYIHIDEDGNEYGFHGVFHGEPSPQGIVQTFEFEGYPATCSWTPRGSRRSTVRRSSTQLGVPVGRGPRRHAAVGHGDRAERGVRAADELLGKPIANS